jgi:glycosyltransferase involved in cell wall biosynthesis
MRILRVVSDLYPFVVGGLGIHARDMSRLQAWEGHDVTVITNGRGTERKALMLEQEGYHVLKIPASLCIFGNTICLALPSHIRRIHRQFDIIHAHSHLFFSTLVCAIIHRLRSTPPLIITNHGLISQTAPVWLQKIYLPTLGRWTLDSADRILCYTETEKQQLVDFHIDPEKITVIHNGINTKVFFPSEKKPGKQILWIGRYTPGKGVEYLIEAFALFHREFPEYRLLLIGDGPKKEQITRMIRELGLASSVTLLDFVPNADIPAMYRQSAMFVLPSLEEGVPRTILEAMSSSVPVVCTDLPQLVDIVSGAGILVPVKDSKALAKAISHIASHPDEARKLGEYAHRQVVSRYSWEDTVFKTLRLYKEVTHAACLKERRSVLQHDRYTARYWRKAMNYIVNFW